MILRGAIVFVNYTCRRPRARARSFSVTPRTRSLADGVLSGDRSALARSITLVESRLPAHQEQAQKLIEIVCAGSPPANRVNSFRLGLAGPPGAGKSTLCESLGMYLVGAGHRVAVIAVDPSSTRTGGSILGDKTRMNELSRHPGAFVRPSATSGVLGGIAQHTNDVVLLLEAAGYSHILVESVGVGQSEVAIDAAVDMLCLVLPPAGGDELQVKRGIMEHADLVLINKSDGDLAAAARRSATEVMHALQFCRRKHQDWRPRVKRCSALQGSKIAEAWAVVEKFRGLMVRNGGLGDKRKRQNEKWMMSNLHEMVASYIQRDAVVRHHAGELAEALEQQRITPRAAARDLLGVVLSEQRHS